MHHVFFELNRHQVRVEISRHVSAVCREWLVGDWTAGLARARQSVSIAIVYHFSSILRGEGEKAYSSNGCDLADGTGEHGSCLLQQGNGDFHTL